MTWLELADGFPALNGVPRPSLALIAVPGTGAVQALEHAAAARVRTAILYEPDEAHVTELAAIAAKHGIHLLGPGSSGLQRPHLQLNACIAGSLQRAGSLALVSQSGALTAAMLDWAESNGVRFSAVVATGRSAVLDLADILDFLAQDGCTQSIIVYMEGIRSARRFMSALRAASRAKPVIVLKAGRRDRGRHAALTHSGTMVGGDDVFDAALERAGAVRVDSFVQLFSAAKCLAGRYRPTGNRLGVIGNGGGPGVLAADNAFLRGIDTEAIARAATATLPAIRKPFIGCWMGETRLRETRLRVSEAGLPVFRLPEAAVDAFANITSFYRNQ